MRPFAIRPLAHRFLLKDLLFPNLLSTRRFSTLRLSRRPTAPPPTPTTTRSFWSFRQLTPQIQTAPGIRVIEKLVGSLDTQEGRPPAAEALVKAFHDVVGSWENSIVSDEHAHGLAITYEYLRTLPGGVGIPVEDLRAALKVVRRGKSAHLAGLARVLFNGIGEVTEEDVVSFVSVLANSGNTAEAVEVVRRCNGVMDLGEKRCWEKILRGFAMEGDEETLLATWELLRENNVKLAAKQFYPMVKFYCQRGDVTAVREWYNRMVKEAELTPGLSTYVGEVLQLCVEKGETEWAQDIIASIIDGMGKEGSVVSREAWDVVLQWTGVITEGDPSDKIDLLLTTMEKQADHARFLPNIETFNELIRFAANREDFEGAERYHSLAVNRGYEPNRTTLELQIKYLTLSGKLGPAREVYEQLRREDIPKYYRAHDVKAFLRALCKLPEPDMEAIRYIYMDLIDWGAKFERKTLCVLLNLFLTQCNFQEVIALLSRDTAEYSARDRWIVINEIGEYIGRNTTSIEAAWDSYQILYQVFPELSVRQRTDIMRLFFELDRSDMATMVFKHMRGTPGRRPNKYTYIIAFHGIAYSRDIEALKVVHNALKLDQVVDLDTRLTNSLMNAYNQCGIPGRALRFWEDIKKSAEGPDYESISVLLESCGNMMYDGIVQARIVWGQLRAMGVKPTLDNYCSYIETSSKQGKAESALFIAKEMEVSDGVRPNARVLGTLYVTTSLSLRSEVAEWAAEAYPMEWKEVEERLKDLPEDVWMEEALERLGGGQLRKLLQGSQQMMLAVEKAEPIRVRSPVYAKL